MSLNVQGSQLFFIDPETDDTVVDVGCVTQIGGIGASREQVDTTCITDIARRIEAGMLQPGAANFTILFDPRNTAHVRMHQLYREGLQIQWALGLSDGQGIAPGGDSDGQFNLPATRSWLTFEGFINDFPWDFAIGQKVSNNLALQISDFPEFTAKV
jgi:hypothetical protein